MKRGKNKEGETEKRMKVKRGKNKEDEWKRGGEKKRRKEIRGGKYEEDERIKRRKEGNVNKMKRK